MRIEAGAGVGGVRGDGVAAPGGTVYEAAKWVGIQAS
jgi:hypothetical protein